MTAEERQQRLPVNAADVAHPDNPRNPFHVRGSLSVVDAATVICVRRRPSSRPARLLASEVGQGARNIFGDREHLEFKCGWEVLLGQAEVVNWMRSTRSEDGSLQIRTMRYAGEWKIFGGQVDQGEDYHAAALRELEEELGVRVPPSTLLRPFNAMQTRPIRSKSNMMFNFVCLADENAWLKDLDLELLNSAYQQKRDRFHSLVEDGSFFAMPEEQKERVAPEVHAVEWVPLHEAVARSFSSMHGSPPPLNAYQAEQFARYGMTRSRDPMFITAASLLELEAFPKEAALIEWTERTSLDTLRQIHQWLFDGMAGEDVKVAFEARRVSSMIEWGEIERLRDERSSQLNVSRL